MTRADARSLSRTGQRLVVEYKRGHGTPPSYPSKWQPVWGALVDRIEINPANKPNIAVVWLPGVRWQSDAGVTWGDMIRIRTDESSIAAMTILFVGYVTKYMSGFSGGSDRPGSAYERNGILCMDHRWLLAATAPIYGQISRGPDDYNNYGQEAQAAKSNSYTFMSGRRCIFNADGQPNLDPAMLEVYLESHSKLCDMPIFADTDTATAWTAGNMINYCLSPLINLAYDYLRIKDPLLLVGLDHSDFNKVINHVVVDGLNVLDAVSFICKNIGWSFREEYYNDGTVTLVFYKTSAASGYTRSTAIPTIMHRLHAPAVGDNIATAVRLGCKMLWAMDLDEDISQVINNPWGLGSPQRFEFTTELVPAWLDTDLTYSTSNPFLTESQLRDIADPNSNDYYKYYHVRGSEFRRDVGRRWTLNESGRYSSSSTYNRGMPFDFSDDTLGIDKKYTKKNGKRLFGPFKRQLLPCLTSHDDSLASVGILVQFSFDAGVTWQVIPCSITSLSDECGIYIAEPNIAEIGNTNPDATITGGTLNGVALNYFSSLCDDHVNSRSFKDKAWKTRVRVTASIQLDQRLARQSPLTSDSGSPFKHSHIYDFSKKYGLSKRATSSVFTDTVLPVNEIDSNAIDSPLLDDHLDSIRDANQDMSISAQFTLDRLWLGDGSAFPDFALGDCVEAITGRSYTLSATIGSTKIYPEIIQIIYMPGVQRQKLITRDLRYAEVTL